MVNLETLKSNNCKCGHRHDVSIKNIIIRKNALEDIPLLLKSLTEQRKIYLISDKNTFKAAGRYLATILQEKGYLVSQIILTGDKIKPDTEQLFKILKEVKNDGYLIACGSGTINDLVKYLAHKFNNHYLVVGTAPSMDGYTSSVSPIIFRGIKNTYESTAPEAVVMDLNILREAPWQLMLAGIGDLLGKATSLLDWKMSHILFNEYFCERIFAIIEAQLANLINLFDRLMERDYDSVKVLIEGLINSGLGMELVGNSRPASGSEHHIAHYIDMCSMLYNKKAPLHGSQVGLGVFFTSSFYLRLKDVNFKEIKIINDKDERVERIKKAYGSKSTAILSNLDKRWKKETLTLKVLEEKEDLIKEMVYEFTPYLEGIKTIIGKTGLLQTEEVKQLYFNGWLEGGLRYGFEYRPRFTITALLYQTGLLDKWVDDMISGYPLLFV